MDGGGGLCGLACQREGEGSEDSVSMPSLSSESMEEEHEEEHTH